MQQTFTEHLLHAKLYVRLLAYMPLQLSYEQITQDMKGELKCHCIYGHFILVSESS